MESAPKDIVEIVNRYVHMSFIGTVHKQLLRKVEQYPELVNDQLIPVVFYAPPLHKHITPNKRIYRRSDGVWRLYDSSNNPPNRPTLVMRTLMILDGCFTMINGVLHLYDIGGRSTFFKIVPVQIWNPSYNRVTFIRMPYYYIQCIDHNCYSAVLPLRSRSCRCNSL